MAQPIGIRTPDDVSSAPNSALRLATPAESAFLRDAMQDFQLRQAFWLSRYSDFLAAYPEQYVAVKEGEVLFTANDLDELCREAKLRSLDPSSDFDFEYITSQPSFAES